MENRIAKLPEIIKEDPLEYYKGFNSTCYWSNDFSKHTLNVMNFIKRAKEYNYSEEQALAVLMFNQFDQLKSDCDLKIYRPMKRLARISMKRVIKLIGDGIVKNIKCREHRDFNELIFMFPGFSVGDILEAYARHRIKIRKQTLKAKRILRRQKVPDKGFYLMKEYNGSHNNGGNNNNNECGSGGGGNNNNNNDNNNNNNNDILCNDMQFQIIYAKQYELIRNPKDIDDEKNKLSYTNWGMNSCGGGCSGYGNGVSTGILKGDNGISEADTLLGMLRRVNKRRNGFSTALEPEQLMSLLGSDHENDDKSTIKSGTKVDCTLKDKLFKYIKSNPGSYNVDSDTDEEREDDSYKNLCDQHENLLLDFQNYLPEPEVFQKLTHTWNNMDFAIFLLGLRKFGKDFRKISECLLTKSETMVRSFYINYRQEFDFDSILYSHNSELYDQCKPLTVNTFEDTIVNVEKEKYIPSPMCPSASNTESEASHDESIEKMSMLTVRNLRSRKKIIIETKKEAEKIEFVGELPKPKVSISVNKDDSVSGDGSASGSATKKSGCHQKVINNTKVCIKKESVVEEIDEEAIEPVIITRVLRDRAGTNERFKSIIEEERKARNRKNYKRPVRKKRSTEEESTSSKVSKRS